MIVLNFDTNCADGTFNLPYRAENGLSAVGDQAVLLRGIRPAHAVGRWSGATAGWTTGGVVMRYDSYTHSYVAFLTIACFAGALSRILG
jgi:hypothetical protein